MSTPSQKAYDEEKAIHEPPAPQDAARFPEPAPQDPYSYNQHGPVGENDLPPNTKAYESLNCGEKTALWLCVVFIPPLAVYMRRGSDAKEFTTSLILWICLGICAGFYAAHVVTKYP